MDLEEVRGWLRESRKITGFSGAGISTESGIPDFRSPGGIWANNRTVYFQDFISNEDDRIEYWRQKSGMWPEMRDARPNAGHKSLASLYKDRKLLGLITQNIDGLHQKGGLPPEAIVEIHGTTTEVICLSCALLSTMDEACERVGNGEKAPVCKKCGGLLKPNTISFGQSLLPESLRRAEELSRNCDLFLALGSSLVVQPAASFPAMAKESGARLVIINRTETPLDGLADAVFHDSIGETMSFLTSLP